MNHMLTPKQEKFCQKYIELSNASEAYRQAYDAENMKTETIHVKASELLANGKVAVRIKELQSLSQERHLVTVESITLELEEARKIARDEKEASPMISASMGKAKIHGLVTDKQKIDVEVTEVPLSPLDYAKRMAFIFKKAEKELE